MSKTELQIRGNGLQTQIAEAALLAKYDPILEFALSYDLMLGGCNLAPKHPVNETSRLIPPADLPILTSALERKLDLASPKQVGGALGLVATAWPFAWQRLDDETGAAFTAQLGEELSRYPAAVLHNAIRTLRRTQKFAPAIAEFISAAESEMDETRRRLRLVREHEREHARRARAAQQEEERQAEDRRKRQKRLDDLIAIYGPTFSRWTADDVADAGTGLFAASLQTLRAWADATEAAEPWAPAAMPLAIVAGRAWPLHRDGHLPAAALCRLLQIARSDPDAAFTMLSDLTSAPDPKYIARLIAMLNGDTEDAWSHPSRLLAALFAEIQHEHSSARQAEGTDGHPHPIVGSPADQQVPCEALEPRQSRQFQ